MTFDQHTLNVVKRYAEKHSLPVPTEEIGSGLEGVVYATDSQDVVVKISPSMKGYEIIEMQGDPGVVTIFHSVEIQVDSEQLKRYGYGFDGKKAALLVIWMERLVAVGSAIFDVLRISSPQARKIEEQLELVNGMKLSSLKHGIPILRRYSAFRSLNQLLSRQGWSDIGIQNVGLSRTGQVVAFDW